MTNYMTKILLLKTINRHVNSQRQKSDSLEVLSVMSDVATIQVQICFV
jgi:hypothetical protein